MQSYEIPLESNVNLAPQSSITVDNDLAQRALQVDQVLDRNQQLITEIRRLQETAASNIDNVVKSQQVIKQLYNGIFEADMMIKKAKSHAQQSQQQQ